MSKKSKLKKYNYKCRNCGYILEVKSDEEMLQMMIVKCPKCGNQLFEKMTINNYNPRTVIVLKELKIVKVTCSKCGHLNFIPGFETLTVDNPIKCEKCGKVLVVRE